MGARYMFFLSVFVLLAIQIDAVAAPTPKPRSSRYDLDIHGFNDGEPYRLSGAGAEAVLADKRAVVFRFKSRNWLTRDQLRQGTHVHVSEIKSKFAKRTTAQLFDVYRIGIDGDGVPEILLVAKTEAIGDGRRYAPTILKLGPNGYRPVWAAMLPGERFRVVDIRDLDADGNVEVLLAGEAGRSGYYQFHELAGFGANSEFETLSVRHVDSIHYVDLNRDGKIEIVVRECVGRRGPAYQWTYIDHLHRWDGQRFRDAHKEFPQYHDVQTLPTLLGGLIDHYDAKLPILMEKVGAIKRVRAEVLARVKRPPNFKRRLVAALGALQKNRPLMARRRLEELDRVYRYEPQVLLGLAQLHSAGQSWELVLDHAIRALTVAPQNRKAWWWVGVALVRLAERSSAVASLHNAATIGGSLSSGIAFLKARRSEPGIAADLRAAIDQALAELTKP